MNTNWPRWIFASCTKHFSDALSGKLTLWIEGEKKLASIVEDYAELHIQGLKFHNVSHDYFLTEVRILTMIHSIMNMDDFHRVHRDVGYVTDAYSTIQVFKYGTLSGTDDDSQIACLELIPTSLSVIHFGQIKPSVEIQRVLVDGTYKTVLEE